MYPQSGHWPVTGRAVVSPTVALLDDLLAVQLPVPAVAHLHRPLLHHAEAAIRVARLHGLVGPDAVDGALCRVVPGYVQVLAVRPNQAIVHVRLRGAVVIPAGPAEH